MPRERQNGEIQRKIISLSFPARVGATLAATVTFIAAACARAFSIVASPSLEATGDTAAVDLLSSGALLASSVIDIAAADSDNDDDDDDVSTPSGVLLDVVGLMVVVPNSRHDSASGISGILHGL